MEVIQVENEHPIFSWCPNVEEGVLETAKQLMKLPFIHRYAIMPDAHVGNGPSIGSVIASDVIIPWAVGSDCGCGVAAIRTSLHKSEIEDRELREKLLHSFGRSIPVSFAHNSSKRENELLELYGDKIDYIIEKSGIEDHPSYNPFGKNIERNTSSKLVASQLATLGGG